jgi:hypothetical protein
MQLVKITQLGPRRFHGTSENNWRYINKLTPIAGTETDPHMEFAQAPRGCAKQPVRPFGRTIRISLNTR